MKICILKTSNLDSRSNLSYVISNVFFPSSFEGNFCAHNAYKDTNLILHLVDFVTTPAEKVFHKDFIGLVFVMPENFCKAIIDFGKKEKL